MYIYKVYFLSECLLHWYIIYLKIFFILYVISCAFCQFVSIILFTIFFFICLDGCLSFSLPCLSLPCLFPCPAYFCALPISSPDAFFPVHSACFLALPTSLPCLFPCPAYFLALPFPLPCLLPCPPISLTY